MTIPLGLAFVVATAGAPVQFPIQFNVQFAASDLIEIVVKQRICHVRVVEPEREIDAAIHRPVPPGDHKIRVIEPPCVPTPNRR